MNTELWIVAAALLPAAIALLRRPLGALLRLLARSAVGLAALGVLGQLGGLAGVTLGVNWVNALVLGALGVPGLGLLLLLNWTLG